MEYAPIVLFLYNRPNHAMKTVEALMKNNHAEDSHLYVFCDGALQSKDERKIASVRKYARKISGFKSVTIVERKKNWGLAANIIDGVTDIVNKYGKVIVIEDDIVTSPSFLTFMNDALNYYEDKKKVFHISGWNYPIDTTGLEDVFFWRAMNCWGWATWQDRWKYFDRNPEKVLYDFDNDMIKRFDLNHSGVFWKQILNNITGKSNTWAIFWYASIFREHGLCLHPSHSYVRNIGDDGSGDNHRNGNVLLKVPLNVTTNIKFHDKIQESSIAVDRIIDYYKSRKKPLFIRAINKIRSIKLFVS